MNKRKLVGERVFENASVQNFAQMSGDFNPMHVDAQVARRLMTGKQVVHGMLVALTAISYCVNILDRAITRVTCSFLNPISVDDIVHFYLIPSDDSTLTIDAVVEGLTCARICVFVDPQYHYLLSTHESSVDNTNSVSTRLSTATLKIPLEHSPSFHVGQKYAIKLPTGFALGELAAASKLLGESVFASLCALSYAVGMICPGLHSIFSSFTVNVAKRATDEADTLLLAVRRFDPRFSLFNMDVDGVVRGEIKSFLRPEPISQPSISALSKLVDPREFGGSTSLIIGASRGLGEITTKLLALGGAHTFLTYASGVDDVNRLKKEIDTIAGAKSSILKFDLVSDAVDSLGVDWERIDAVYFFATPRISRKRIGTYQHKVFLEFLHFYVDQFYALCSTIESKRSTGKVVVFYPSTVFIDERPRGMTEYTAAKAAAEIVAEEISKTFRKVSLIVNRLPKMDTDQTATVVPSKSISATEVMIAVVREVNKLIRSQAAEK
jgi:NAD(P)-dependent dehydrogenase (short-subunit alcohol dehydrogenase family)